MPESEPEQLERGPGHELVHELRPKPEPETEPEAEPETVPETVRAYASVAAEGSVLSLQSSPIVTW